MDKIYSNQKHKDSLDKILQNIKGLKSNIRESYKKIKCSNDKEQEVLNQNL